MTPGDEPSRVEHDHSHGSGHADRLRRLEAVTDLSLSRMSLDELLPELLDRVRDLLSADTAAVLLLDESEEFVYAVAAGGLEEEVRQGTRVHLGRGFAGRIAATRRPVVLDDVNPSAVVNPILLMKGIRSMLGVPLLDGEELLGVLHVGSLRQRTFRSEDIELLEQAAERAAAALTSERARTRNAAAMVLQRSLAPRRLADIPHTDVAARYVPGSELDVGGDWYDVFALPSGRLGVAIGDVMGHGFEAAAVMGRLSAMLRGYALQDEDPATVLSSLDLAVHAFEAERMATVLYGVYDAETGTLVMSSAGHVPPMRAGADGVELLDLTGDLSLGVDLAQPRHTHQVRLASGALLCLYTDGLVDHPHEDIDSALQAMRHVLARGRAIAADQVCADLMAELIGPGTREDDVALLILRRTAEERG